jgi:cytochrome c oxidase subunit 3
MSLFGQLTDKSWLPADGAVDYYRDASPARTRRVALRVFLSVVTVIFLLLIVAYADRMSYGDWRPAPQTNLLWANTFVLILASAAFQWAVYAVRRARFDAMRIGLLAGGAFTVVFLVGQLLAWRQLANTTYFELTNPAVAFFYLITALHGLHLLGGLVAWGRTVVSAWGEFDVARIRQNVELCTLYWHFLLLVWGVLFGLLFSGDNLDLLLKLCGIR